MYCDNLPVDYDGDNYLINGNPISESKLDSMKSFLFQICENNRSYSGANFNLNNYSNPFAIFSVQNSQLLSNEERVLMVNGKEMSEEKKDELFKFSYGVFHDQPFFMLKGKYGEDFSVSLNGEELIYRKKKLFL